MFGWCLVLFGLVMNQYDIYYGCIPYLYAGCYIADTTMTEGDFYNKIYTYITSLLRLWICETKVIKTPPEDKCAILWMGRRYG